MNDDNTYHRSSKVADEEEEEELTLKLPKTFQIFSSLLRKARIKMKEDN